MCPYKQGMQRRLAFGTERTAIMPRSCKSRRRIERPQAVEIVQLMPLCCVKLLML